MNKIKRITPEQVVARYKELGWKPARELFYEQLPDGTVCACGLGVMAGEDVDDDASSVFDYAVILGLEQDYALGFVEGFDGGYPGSDLSEAQRIGYEDGRACWEVARREVLGVVD